MAANNWKLYGLNVEVDNISVKEITDDTDLPRINYEGFSYQDSLGSEEVVNGDFATNSNWTLEIGLLKIVQLTNEWSKWDIIASNDIVAGKKYKVDV